MNPTFCSLYLPHKQVRKNWSNLLNGGNTYRYQVTQRARPIFAVLIRLRFSLFCPSYLKVADSRPKVAGLANHQIFEGAVSMFQCSSFFELIVSHWRSYRLPDTGTIKSAPFVVQYVSRIDWNTYTHTSRAAVGKIGFLMLLCSGVDSSRFHPFCRVLTRSFWHLAKLSS